MLQPRVGGRWLSELAAFSPVTVEHGLHGGDRATFQVPYGFRHPLLRGNMRCSIYDGGFVVFEGTLLEPSPDGQMTAIGVWRQAERATTRDAGGAFTTIPTAAVDGALGRGEITWGRIAGLSASSWATDNTGQYTLAQLLNGWAGEANVEWRVDRIEEGITYAARPTTPQWYVPHAVAGRGLTPAEDNFYTHLTGTYMSGAGTYDTWTVSDALSASAWGPRYGQVDLTSMGIITAGRAQTILSAMLVKSGARMGWAEGLELGWGEITTAGGTPVPLRQVRAGQMIRLLGTVDPSIPGGFPGHTDIIIETSKYTDGAQTITLTPLGYADRTLSDVLTAPES
jgi:hypothetical protein